MAGSAVSPSEQAASVREATPIIPTAVLSISLSLVCAKTSRCSSFEPNRLQPPSARRQKVAAPLKSEPARATSRCECERPHRVLGSVKAGGFYAQLAEAAPLLTPKLRPTQRL